MKHAPSPLTSIGTTEFIDFPDDAIFGVPAKIDTGADYSAIWASGVTLEDGLLRFYFFAPGSPHYQQRPVSTSAFKKVRVKNSFGDTESRYKIKLRVQIGRRKLTRWFSLADRSRSTYPILLGKNFLKNTFVVDVAASHIASEPVHSNKILVLGAAKSGAFFTDVLERMKHPAEITCASYDDLTFYLDGLDTAVMYHGSQFADLAAYGLVYFKSHGQAPEVAAAVAEYLKFRGCRFYDTEIAHYVSASKLSAYMKLTCGGVRIPKTVSGSLRYLQTHYDELARMLGAPFVLKEAASDRGRKNYLVNSQKDFDSVLRVADDSDRYVAQKFVPNDGFYRLLVTGKKISLAVWRKPHPSKDTLKKHLNKPSGGVNAQRVEPSTLPPECSEAARQAALCMDRQVAGVDMVQDEQTGEWFVLEVNNAPQLRSGSYVEDKAQALAELFDKELNR